MLQVPGVPAPPIIRSSTHLGPSPSASTHSMPPPYTPTLHPSNSNTAINSEAVAPGTAESPGLSAEGVVVEHGGVQASGSLGAQSRGRPKLSLAARKRKKKLDKEDRSLVVKVTYI